MPELYNYWLIVKESMCYYITVAFPKKTANSILTSLPKDLNSLPATNPAINKLLPKDYDSFAIITAMCSCDLYSPTKAGEKDKEKEALRRKYKKKGWPENKIQRAIADHEKDVKVKRVGFRDDFLYWLTALAAKSAASLFVLVHFYSGDIETEELNIKRDKVKAEDLRVRQQSFAEDILVEITN